MHLPQLQQTQQRTLMTTTFGGYNHTNAVQDGEMYDMLNLSSRSFPLLDQRPKRAFYDPLSAEEGDRYPPDTATEGQIWIDSSGETKIMKIYTGTEWVPVTHKLTGIHGRDKMVICFGDRVYYDGTQVSGISVSPAEDMYPKKIVSMGAYVCIWPDKVYFNTANTSDSGEMGQENAQIGNMISLVMTRIDGSAYTIQYISSTTPGSANAGDLWIDTSGQKHVLKQYSSAGEWDEIATTYIKITGEGIGKGLSMYDTVSISGMSKTVNGTPDMQVADLNVDSIVYGCGDDYIIVAGILDQAIFELDGNGTTANVFVKREIPDLDYVCESNNRIWGCRYGTNNGESINEIRACKLGDFKNWNCYMGLSTDSYAASVGTDGPFTGAVNQRGYPIFYKENSIMRVTGNLPSSFSTNVISIQGVQEGSWRSIASYDENIYYKSRDGVYYFDGSMTYKISDALGEIRYSDARAGILDGKYYISMRNTNGEWSLFAYDIRQKLWHREDNMKVMGFATVDGELFAIDEDRDLIVMMTGQNPEQWDATAEDDFNWSATFGLFGTDYTNQKYLGRFNLRMQIDEDAEVHLKIMYDQDGVWHDQGEIRGKSTRTFMLPVIPRRCDHLQVQISGNGRCRIYSMSRMLEVGGDG